MSNTNLKKVIIFCPGCKHRVRVPKYKNIVFTCPNCNNQVNYDGRINKKPIYIGSILLILAIAYFTFFGDYFSYLNVKKEQTQEACSRYYNSYPRGYFLEEVSFIEITIAEDIELVRSFLKLYPNSAKHSEVLKINKDLWDAEIDYYNKSVENKEGLDLKAVHFFRNLLSYMRDNNESTLYLDLIGNVEVKNFEEYNTKVKNRLDSVMVIYDNRNVSDNIIEIKKNYRQGNLRSYENIINGAVEAGFENILSHNFIKVSSIKNPESSLTIKINYDIKNQERYSLRDNVKDPVIWIYTKGKNKEDFISFLIGISINYTFNIELPDSNESFEFEYKTNALDNINNIRDVEEGYKRMTAQNFNNYSNVITTKFGLIKEQKSTEEQ